MKVGDKVLVIARDFPTARHGVIISIDESVQYPEEFPIEVEINSGVGYFDESELRVLPD